MPDLKARSGGQWSPAIGPPAVKAKAVSATSFTRQVAAAWSDDDAGGWLKINDLVPAQPVLTVTNNSGRIDLSWTIASTNNLQKYQVWYSTDNVNYYVWGTEPVAGQTSAIFGRVPVTPPVTYYFILRAIALNGTSTDSAVKSVSIPGVTSFGFTHSRGSSGWHTRTFSFTASATSTSTIKTMTCYLYWRRNTNENWEYVTEYYQDKDSTSVSMSQTFTFSAFDSGQRMFAVYTVVTDNQTLQNNGSTGGGYGYADFRTTSELTAADISGGVPTISGLALGKSDPGGAQATNDRQIRFTVGFDANVDRSEYDSAIIVLYNAVWQEVSRQTVDINYLKEQPWTRRELNYTFSSLDAGAIYYGYFYVYDDQGADQVVANGQITLAVQTTTYTYVNGYSEAAYGGTYDAGNGVFLGQNENLAEPFIGDAPYGNQAGYGTANLRDDNNGTNYITTSIGSTGSQYQRLRVYKFYDFSLNNSSFPGSPPYTLDWIQYVTNVSHRVWAGVFDYRRNLWLGYQTEPSLGDYAIANNTFSGSWRLDTVAGVNFEGVATVNEGGGSRWSVLFDVRATLGNKTTVAGLANRLSLGAIRVRTTWYSRNNTTATGSYTW